MTNALTLQRFAQELTTPGSLPSGVVPLAGWRWFIDGDYLVFEPLTGIIQLRDMTFLDMHAHTTNIEAVLRTTPNPGIYLRCKLAAETP